jgi:hypothetical protein
MDMETVDQDGDGIITRAEWRQWMEQKTAILQSANQQRQHLIQENNKLRKIIQDSKSPMAAAAAAEQCQRERQEQWRTMTSIQVQLSRLRVDMERGRKELHEALIPFHANWFREAQLQHNYEDLDKLDLLLRWEQTRAEQVTLVARNETSSDLIADSRLIVRSCKQTKQKLRSTAKRRPCC